MSLDNKDQRVGSSRRSANHIGWVLMLAVAAVCLLSLPTNARAEVSFCSFGSGPGQCDRPGGVAVDRSTGNVYVVDKGNSRVNAFDESGSFLRTFGSPGTGNGQFSNPVGIAVDNDPASSAFHDVYITDRPGKGRVQRFSPSGEFVLSFGSTELNAAGALAVGPGGAVYVANEGTGVSHEIKKFKADGTPAGSSALTDTGIIRNIVVNSAGDLYVNRRGIVPDFIEKYALSEPNATLIESFDSGASTNALAIGPENHLFAAQINAGRFVISERGSNGTLVKRFGYGEIQFPLEGLAVGPSGTLFGSEEYVGLPSPGNRVITLTPPAPGALACCLGFTAGNTSALLKGGINPEGKEATYHFEYLTQAQFESDGNDFGTGTIKTPESPLAGSDFDLHNVQAEVGCEEPSSPPQESCLKPETKYRYRFVATNEDGQSIAEGEFETKPALEITATFATEVGLDAAQLHATVNPLGIPATGYIEYVDDAKYQADLAQGEGHDGFAEATKTPDVDAGQAQFSFGAGKAERTMDVQVQGLAPGTVYHYRAVAGDPFLSLTGLPRMLTTFPPVAQPSNTCSNAAFRIGPARTLPDCRAYEMVSPVDKNGGDIKVLLSNFNYPPRLESSSDSGDDFAFSSLTSFPGAQSAPWTSEYLASRKAGESWMTQAISPPRESTSLGPGLGKFDSQFKVFAPDLSSGWLVQEANPTLSNCAQEGLINLYRRDNSTGTYEALIPGEQPLSGAPVPGSFPEMQGISADGTHSVFRFGARLTKDAANTTYKQLYEHVRGEGCGELHLVSVLPNGKAAADGVSVGTGGLEAPNESRRSRVTRAVSTDGRRIFWTSADVDQASLYIRINADQKQSAVSAGKCTEPAQACTIRISAEPANFWDASADGSKAIYSVGDLVQGSARLYTFDLQKALAGEVASELIAEGVRSVVGASEDAARFYFVSREALGGEGKAGRPNLYLRDGEVTRLVATLNGGSPFLPDGDLNLHFTRLGFAAAQPTSRSIPNGIRLTTNGRHLAFVSTESLTGYDNADAENGLPDLELYLYSADADKLVCISCNPSGARPQGREFRGDEADRRMVSAMMAPGENQFFAPRALSGNADKLFFESFETLLPADTNGKADVYEWQAGESQSECSNAGATLFVASSGGCLSLISTGQSPVDSELADASPDGSNVFIRTASSLLPQDPGQVDIYDARENGGLPQPPTPAAVCEGEACQGPLVPPDDPTPSSSTFQGMGNVLEKRVKKSRKKKHKKRKSHKHGHSAKAHKGKRAKDDRRAGR